ncbi:MAG TPA: protein kinase [Candidatus Eisenbacteria bacterium]|nr:protein kinase [Candidatus Eisenbacteria bacterium]
MSRETLVRLQTALAKTYEVQRELARGGMGHVFEARDLKHGRSVAIKVLDPELARAIGPTRFRAEIETAARLVHPHIVPLFDSGEADGLFYFVMPLLTGESLRKRLMRETQLPVEDAVRIAREAGDALRYAHEQGLVHRDVKPENIVLAGGHALVLDFGIARGSGASPSAETRTVTAVGTPAYMSPEQSSGAVVDGRSDQYALACVLYEMLTGQPPFQGPTGDSVLLQHRTVDPRPATALRPTTPTHVTQALARAFAKAPADRYPSMAAFLEALRPASEQSTPTRGTGTRGQGRIMLAVLPLENRSADPEQEFFTDGMTEELITHLGRIQPKRLGVIARTSAMRYRKTEKSAEEIGRELGVEYLLEGSVRRAGDRVRITTQLVQVADQSHLWAETYERRMQDIFDLQDEVATSVAKALEVELVRSREPASPSSDATAGEAIDAYLRGRFYWNQRTPESLRLAVDWFQRAIAIDPDFARPYAGLADTLNVQVTYMMIPAEAAYETAEAAARRAIELDRGLAEGHASLASILTHRRLVAEARPFYERALEIDPNYLPALYWYAVHLVGTGNPEEASVMAARALQIDPLSRTAEIVQGNVHFFAGRRREALVHYRRGIELEPKMPWLHMRTALTRASMGEVREALADVEAATEFTHALEIQSTRVYLLGKLGRMDEARSLLQRLLERARWEYVSWEHFAYAYAGLDDRERLFDVLAKAPKVGTLSRLFLALDPAFAPYRTDPRFQSDLIALPAVRTGSAASAR